MFGNCDDLTSLDLSNFDTSNVTDMAGMFAGCTDLTTLNIRKFNTSKVTDMTSMFYDCRCLTSLNLSNFDTSKVTSMSSMFYGCHRLGTLNLSSFDLSKIIGIDDTFKMFGNCYGLTNLQAPKNIKSSINLQDCTKLTHTSLMSVINNLTTVTTERRIVLGTENYNKLTSGEIAIAENKGWTVLETY
jgi:surface protein